MNNDKNKYIFFFIKTCFYRYVHNQLFYQVFFDSCEYKVILNLYLLKAFQFEILSNK